MTVVAKTKNGEVIIPTVDNGKEITVDYKNIVTYDKKGQTIDNSDLEFFNGLNLILTEVYK